MNTNAHAQRRRRFDIAIFLHSEKKSKGRKVFTTNTCHFDHCRGMQNLLGSNHLTFEKYKHKRVPPKRGHGFVIELCETFTHEDCSFETFDGRRTVQNHGIVRKGSVGFALHAL